MPAPISKPKPRNHVSWNRIGYGLAIGLVTWRLLYRGDDMMARVMTASRSLDIVPNQKATTTGNTPTAILPAVVSQQVPPPKQLQQEQRQQQQQQQEQEQKQDVTTIAPTTGDVPGVRSVFTYQACCGIGHRLVRQASAYHASHRLGFQLKVDWLQCGKQDIFSSMFRDETEDEVAAYAHSLNESYFLSNEVPSYLDAGKNCAPDEVDSNIRFYEELKARFRAHDAVEAFVQQHFHGKFALGIHIRDGNGEKGLFVDADRGLKVTPEEFTKRAVKKIIEIVENAKNQTQDLPPPVLFVATDNQRYHSLFRTELESEGIPVVHWEQDLGEEGSGAFLERLHRDGMEDEKCLKNWRDILMDLILIGSADVVIAGQYSSFTQSMPMHLALGRPFDQRPLQRNYCELLEEGSEMDCFQDLMERCMKTRIKWNAVKSLRDPKDTVGWPGFIAEMYKSPNYRKAG
jgi:hypothetical protein